MSRSRHKFPKKGILSAGIPPAEETPSAGPVRITVIDYDLERYEEKVVTNIEECFPYRDTSTVTWINIDGLSDKQVIGKIGSCYSLHPLILEDLLNTQQRPKMEDLESYLYITLKMLTISQEGEVITEHVALILGPNYLISFQENVGDVFDPVRERIRKEGKIRKFGPDYLAYALIDDIVDNYFLVVEGLEERVENLEEELVGNASPQSLLKINKLKKDMIFLRKAVWPLRESINNIDRAESPLIREETRIYFRDIYDHIIQVIDTLETFRDMISGMIDIYLSSLSYKMNEIMKVLTLIATIFIPLTFVAGVYGMNFEYMPEISNPFGYYAVWVVMIAMVITMLVYFRKKHWI